MLQREIQQYQETAKKEKILNHFQPVGEFDLVECGYESDDQFEKLRLVEGSCLILNTLILFFSIVYVNLKNFCFIFILVIKTFF